LFLGLTSTFSRQKSSKSKQLKSVFVSGDAGGLFEIHPDTGNITMRKPADVLETVLRLTVLVKTDRVSMTASLCSRFDLRRNHAVFQACNNSITALEYVA